MGIITLTTDLGHKDFYLASVKGSILNQTPDIRLIDITHSIAPFNIAQGAFLFKNAYPYFPKRTVHILGLNCDEGNNPFLALAFGEQYFVGPDNGLFSLIFDREPEKMVEIQIRKETKSVHFPLKDILVDAACHLASGGTLDALGPIKNNWTKKVHLKPVFGPNSIRGTIIYIDDYQNVITNITRAHFDQYEKGEFEIFFRRKESINKISYHYGEVPEGEKLCLFGISGHLEIAINKGKAAGLLGLKVDDTIQIHFKE